VLGAPGSQVRVASLQRDTPLNIGVVRKAEMLGVRQSLEWKWSPDGLVIQMPGVRPFDDAQVIKLS
jgi:hypothetical protein